MVDALADSLNETLHLAFLLTRDCDCEPPCALERVKQDLQKAKEQVFVLRKGR
jgi:hypothetical protein